MKDGFIRAAAATPAVRVADVEFNSVQIRRMICEAAENRAACIVFPELALTGYTCGDLFRDRLLIKSAEEALKELINSTCDLDILSCVGIPVEYNGALYNTAAVFKSGKLLGLPAKKYIPNYSEFYELRHFTPASGTMNITYCGQEVPLGENIIFSCSDIPDFKIGVEICEDLWVPQPPSINLAMNGATVILNSSCSDEVIGKREYRETMLKSYSGRLISGYVYCDSGIGESTTDMVFAGHRVIAENGSLLAESKLFESGILMADIDVERLSQERKRMNTFTSRNNGVTTVYFESQAQAGDETITERKISSWPFVPSDSGDLEARCSLILDMQSVGLSTRLEHIGCHTAVVGLSGGLDSTLALLVTARAFDRIGYDRKGIIAVTMPGFGTTGRTKGNAELLATQMGVTFRTIPIDKAVMQHFSDIGHDPENLDVTYENSQARERTQILMDIANMENGIVIGTGDLSELALGWATYNGDHMSMYAVNSSVPKTLVRYLVRYAAETGDKKTGGILFDILSTPVSPELLPPENGEISQKTEDLVGPYELHDFFLYYMLRFGFTPKKIYHLAKLAFREEYDSGTIKKWLKVFYRRFFAQQFKRSCLPDGPKVGTVTLSPRGDWRMPSDASSGLWLKQIDELED
jgi:NAD+ synthase (glutamine-hydrolysing)